MFRKGSHRCLTAGKNLKLAQRYYNHYKSFQSGILPQRQIVVIGCVFDIVQVEML